MSESTPTPPPVEAPRLFIFLEDEPVNISFVDDESSRDARSSDAPLTQDATHD